MHILVCNWKLTCYNEVGMFGMGMESSANEIKCITIHWLDCSKNTIVMPL